MPLRLLCVTAHPDDECFAFGGALALAANRGAEVSILCFTEGQAGSYRGPAKTPAQLGQIRRSEFEASCKILNIHNAEMLTYNDGKLELETISTLASEIIQRIRHIRPHVVLTFGGDGAVNTHADHTVVSAATTAAFHWSGSPKRYPNLGDLYQPQRLFYLTTNYFLPDRHKPLPAPWTLTLDIRSVFEKKMEAFRKHTSQAPLEQQVRGIFLTHGQNEYYTLAAAVVPQPAAQSTDMFEGIGE